MSHVARGPFAKRSLVREIVWRARRFVREAAAALEAVPEARRLGTLEFVSGNLDAESYVRPTRPRHESFRQLRSDIRELKRLAPRWGLPRAPGGSWRDFALATVAAGLFLQARGAPAWAAWMVAVLYSYVGSQLVEAWNMVRRPLLRIGRLLDHLPADSSRR